MKKITIVSVIIMAIIAYASWSAGGKWNTITVVNERIVDAMPARVAELKRGVAEQLMACESSGATDEDGLIVFDANRKASIGRFQFQKATVIHYYNLIYGVKLTGKEAVMLALDTERAMELATRIMFETKSMAGMDWVNCDRKLDLDRQISIIKKLY
jgi:hypothetical protein